MAAYSEVRDGILPKFKLIQAFMVDLVTCKNEDPFKNEGIHFSHHVHGDFSKRSRAANSDLAEFRTHSRFITCKNKEPIESEGAWVVTIFFPVITLRELSVTMETRVLIRSGPKPNAANPSPQWCSRWNLITIGQLVSEIVWTDAQTYGRTPARVPSYKLLKRDMGVKKVLETTALNFVRCVFSSENRIIKRHWRGSLLV